MQRSTRRGWKPACATLTSSPVPARGHLRTLRTAGPVAPRLRGAAPGGAPPVAASRHRRSLPEVAMPPLVALRPPAPRARPHHIRLHLATHSAAPRPALLPDPLRAPTLPLPWCRIRIVQLPFFQFQSHFFYFNTLLRLAPYKKIPVFLLHCRSRRTASS